MFTYKVITGTGNRENNEDSAVCLEHNGNYCFVVADGLGGHGKGEVASQKVIEVFQRLFEKNITETDSFLQIAFETAQAEVIATQKSANAMLEMKTTAVALVVVDGKCQWGHIGDSRLYLFNKNKIVTRTLDHSVPQMLVLAGEIKEKHVAKHPDRNRLLRVIGIEWDSPKYELSEAYRTADCQAFLLCSDGFWEHIDEKKMRVFLKKSSSAEEWLDQMTNEVKKNGSGQDMDNHTAIAIIVG